MRNICFGIIGTVGLLFYTSTFAKPIGSSHVFLGDIKCADQVKKTLMNWQSLGKWHPVPGVYSDANVYQTRTQAFGYWIEMTITKRGLVRAVRLSPSEELTVTWGESNCTETHNMKQKALDLKQLGENPFTDSALQKMMTSGKSALLYVWSPGMTYSAQVYKTFKDFAAKKKLQFIPILDNKADLQFARQVGKENKFIVDDRRLASFDLIMRGAINHFPTTFIIQNKKIYDVPIVGAMDLKSLENAYRGVINE